MSTALVTTASQGQQLPVVPWRDPQTVSPRVLSEYIQQLETACLEEPESADLRTCLGMAYAVNFEVYKSLDALEDATAIDPMHFWAQLKYGELLYRLRALNRAEEETLKALELAQNSLQLSVARKQLQQVRELSRASIRNVTWDKPLTKPVLVFVGMVLVLFLVMAVWK
jgi:tetratricopeptide (TPR) repeat protein